MEGVPVKTKLWREDPALGIFSTWILKRKSKGQMRLEWGREGQQGIGGEAVEMFLQQIRNSMRLVTG